MIDKMANEKLDKLVKLTQHVLAIELYKLNVPQIQIARHLGIANKSLNNMLKGIRKERDNGPR